MATEARDLCVIDRMDPLEAALHLVDAQIAAAQAVRSAAPALAAAAGVVAAALAAGHRVIHAGAGSSGLMALADSLELPGTFGLSGDRAVALVAGGLDSLADLAGAPEDNRAAGAGALAALHPAEGDVVLVVAASGRTPWTIGVAEAARKAGATVVAFANNQGAPLLALGDIAVLLETPPEPLAGSTRLGAGTAQKIALNTLSTLAGTLLGRVHDGMMVGLRADNAKLRGRAEGIVAAIAGVAAEAAGAALATAGGEVRTAIMLASGADGLEDARNRLAATGGFLRPALAGLDQIATGPAKRAKNGRRP